MSDRLATPGLAVLPAPTVGPARPPAVPRPERWTLENGLRVIAVPWTTLPQIAARVVIPAGSIADPLGVPGLAAFVGSMLTEGTDSLSADELNAQLDRLGTSLSVQVGHDFAEVDLFMLAETLPEALHLLAQVVRSPAFPEPETERVRAETLDALAARDDEPGNVADDALALALFGETHPYGRPAIGSPEGVEAIGRADLRSFHARHYRPDGAVLVVAGDLEVATLRELVDEAFAGWRGERVELSYPPVPEPRTLRGRVERAEWPDAAQGEIRFGGLGMPRTSPDWVPAAVANYLLGGSTITGRLGANLREEKGWTYGVRSGFAAAVQPGGWVVDTAVDGEVVEGALTEIVRELDLLASEPVSDEELRRAKDALILSLPRAFETPGRILGRFATVAVFGLGEDYWESFPARVEAVTADDVLRAARSYFHPDRLIGVVVGPP